MKKGTVLTAHIDKLIPGGQALATLESGQKAFIWNALPGEDVTFSVTKAKSSYVEGIATEIKNPNPHRIESKDSCYLSTSPWQIMDFDYELAQKTALVAESFRQEHINLSELKPCVTDNNPYHYRNKMEYALYWDNDEKCVYLALHARGSHRKEKIAISSLEHPKILQRALETVSELNSRHEEARKYQSLLLRCDQQGNVSGGLFENGKPHPVFDNLTDEILGVKYSYSPNGFFQINLPVYELALKEIKKHIKTDNVLDLYSGVGTIGLSVARDKNLTLVECNTSAYTELVKNCKITGDEDISFREHPQATAEDETPDTRDGGLAGRRFQKEISHPYITPVLAKSEDALEYISPDQTVILDPPRAGCDRKLLDKLLEQTPEVIIYLSCNPTTQARDVAILLQKYRIKDVTTFNFFPRTPHIENLVILEKL
ncbi:class I SAM-dependent RNA methyltransferase [Candidatus Saccharibacteria bacterium]|nr:class I SAM-dependent RNA methyltransferase [Candidatus Saccharibacteria bacterium]